MKDSSFEPMTMDEIVMLALEKGCTVRVARPCELMFDLDTKDAEDQYSAFFATKLDTTYPDLKVERWASKSGNTHVVVTLPEELPDADRIALQAMGGSDMGREFAALRCLQAGSPHPVLLFVPAVQA